jgi:hypothetical protein
MNTVATAANRAGAEIAPNLRPVDDIDGMRPLWLDFGFLPSN